MANTTIIQKKNFKKTGLGDSKTSIKTKQNKAVSKEIHYRPLDKQTKKKIPYRTKLEKNKQIVIADSNKEKGLDLFCYIKCDNSSPLQVKRARGLVFHGDNLVLKTFPYTDEYSLEDDEAMTRFVRPFFTQENLKQTRFFRSYEGSLVRVFNFDGEWFVTTHRKLDAFKSKWSSNTSFGEMFFDGVRKQMEAEEGKNIKDIKDDFFKLLDKKKSYMFLVLPTADNRVVCKVPDESSPTIYHVGTYENFPSKVFSLDEEIPGIPRPEEYKFGDFKEFENEIAKTDVDACQGLIIFGPRNQLVKVLHPEYFYLFRLRGNEQSIKFRYLQIRTDGDKWRDYGRLYPDFIPEFKEYERRLTQVAADIHNAYVKRYIRKERITIPQEEFIVMSKCNQWHREDPKNNKISPQIISEAMDWEEATSLNKMIKRLIMEERQQDKEKQSEPPETTVFEQSDFPALGVLAVTEK